MARQPKPTAPPLAATLRAALASDWRTLAALDALTAARGSDARRLVHEALREIKAGGCVLEERVGRAGVEVRLLTLPAPVPDDGQPGDLSPEDIEEANDPRACPECEEIHPADDRHDGPFTPNLRRPSLPVEEEPEDYNATDAAADLQAGVAAMFSGGRPIWEVILDGPQKGEQEGAAPAPPVGQAAPVEPVGGPVARDLDALREQVRTNASASVSSGITMAQAWERASVCLDLTPVEEYALCGAFREEWERVEGESQSGEPSATPFDHPPPRREPGPSSRCAVCASTLAKHAPADGHPFAVKPRGRPSVERPCSPPVAPIPNAAPAILPRARQRRTPGPIVDVDGGRVERAHDARVEAIEGVAASLSPSTAAAEPETSRGETGAQAPPTTAASSLADTLRKAFPDAFKPEIIDGSDVATVAREMVDLTIAFSPVIARRDSIDAVGVTPLDNGRFRVDALWETTGLPMEVDAAGLAVMRARYLLLRGLLTRSLSAMDYDTHRAVVRRFFQGVEPWAPAPGSPLARTGAGPITITVPDGVGIEAIDWTALMGALAGEGGEVPAVVPVRPLGPPLPPAPSPEPPAAHVLEGPHDRACGYWKVHDPAHCDPAKLAAEIKICRACWGKMYALGGGRPRIEDGRKYVGCRYV